MPTGLLQNKQRLLPTVSFSHASKHLLAQLTMISGWSVYTSTLSAGETPCVSSTTLPPTATTSGKDVVNVISTQIFTSRYDLVPGEPDTLSQNAQIGITVGGSVVAALIAAAIWIFIRKRRSRIIERKTFIASAQPSLNDTTSRGALFHVRSNNYQSDLEKPEHSTLSQQRSWYPMRQIPPQQSRVPPRPPRPAVPPSELFGDTYIHEYHPIHSPERSLSPERSFYRDTSMSSGHGNQGRINSMDSYGESF